MGGSGSGISRREFLAAANAAAFLLLVESCSLGPIARKAAVTPSLPAGTPEQQALRLLLQAVRSSPDHLALRAEDLVAAKDPTSIVEFVRDRIAAIPTFGSSDDAQTGRRWGPAATLRGGSGTLRERADILADLLTRAGFKATVASATRPPALGADVIYGARTADFSPDESRVQLAESVLRKAGVPAPASLPAFGPMPDAASAISAALPGSAQVARVRDDLVPARIPVVSFVDGGKTRYAFALGDLGVSDSAPPGLRAAGAADDLRSVSITVSAVASPALGSQTAMGRSVELVSGRWPADQVAGRQVLLLFPPVEGAKVLLESSFAALPVRVPMLHVQSDRPASSASQNLSVTGPSITVHGDVLAPATGGAPDGSLSGPYGVIAPLADADRRRLSASARSIRATANAASFLEVQLDVTIADANGSPVNGLDSQAFAVTEDGKTVGGFALYSNSSTQQRPRVLVVYDAAFVDMWPSAAAKSSFESSITQALVAQAGKTPFDVQVIGLGAGPDPHGWAAPKAAQVAAALAAASESADDPWRTVGGSALDQGLAAIVLVSDMDPLDADPVRTPTFQRRLAASRVPVLVAPVGRVNETITTAILAASGGVRMDPTDPATPSKIASWIAPLVSSWTGGAYRIRYTAQADGPAQRTVTIALAEGSVGPAQATYQVPDKPVPPPSFAGLYVTVQVGPMTAFRRIAGVEMTPGGRILGSVDDPVAIAETRAALNGITTIAIEAGTPTQAAMLDDVISSQLSVEPIRRLGPATPDQILEAASGGVRRTPLTLAELFLPQPVSPGAVHGFRVAILQERMPAKGSLETHADFAIGVNEVIPLGSDRGSAFKSALATSLAASLAEGEAFLDSAFGRLSGKALRGLTSGDYSALNEFLKSVPADKADAWRAVTTVYGDYNLAVPAGGSADALWVVDPNTAVAKAVLLDGTGGGIAALPAHCNPTGEDALALLIATLSLICLYAPQGLSYYCVGVNAVASLMCVIQLFDGSSDPGTPISLWMGLADPMKNFSKGAKASVAIMLILLTLANSNCL